SEIYSRDSVSIPLDNRTVAIDTEKPFTHPFRDSFSVLLVFGIVWSTDVSAFGSQIIPPYA
ncbi:hypothetical protein, partial [Pseudomonas aeruginosa]|uniref:hypothetical protein n=1 Tax=Pseudomonas aeruginosa TaxID=287 RepID=UPI004044C83D